MPDLQPPDFLSPTDQNDKARLMKHPKRPDALVVTVKRLLFHSTCGARIDARYKRSIRAAESRELEVCIEELTNKSIASETGVTMLKASIVRFVMALLLMAGSALAQSTLGTILGTVRDSSGAVIPNASVKVTNTDEGASQQATTDSNGNYLVLNQKPAHYSVEVTQSGFQTKTTTELRLIARQELRVDVTLEVGQTTEAVTVQGTAGVITTDTQAISSSYDSLKLLNLPANTRANGSTSPYTMISALPGLQADNNNAFSIQGGPGASAASARRRRMGSRRPERFQLAHP